MTHINRPIEKDTEKEMSDGQKRYIKKFMSGTRIDPVPLYTPLIQS